MFKSEVSAPLPPHLQWRTIPIPRDRTLAGWIAGPVVGVLVHHNGQVSKPCWRRLTDGKLECPSCGKTKVRNIGYLPIVTVKAAERRVIIVSHTVLTTLVDWPVWTPIVCLTPHTRGLPSRVTKSDEASMTSVTWQRLKKRPPEDIRPYLIHLWGVPELIDHFGDPRQIEPK